MWSQKFDLAITLLLLLVLTVVGTTGLLADYLGVPRSLFHRYSAYMLIILAVCHILLNYQKLLSRFKLVVGKHRQPVSVAQPAETTVSKPSRVPNLSRRAFIISAAAGIGGFFLGRWLPLGNLPSDLDETDLGLAYHQWSKPGFMSLLRKPFQWGSQPPLYKEYPLKEHFVLPKNFQYRGLFVEEAIQQRRSIRDYSDKPLTMQQISLLLHSGSGITSPSDPFRASPSAGGLYPLEVYPVIYNVDGLVNGVYHYRPKDHSLDMLKAGNFRTSMLIAAIGQEMVLRAGVVLVITAIFQRTRWKYQDRTYRYILLEAGHLAENVYLAATSLKLGTCVMGAFLDDEVNGLVEVDGKEESSVYLISIGSRT